MVVIQSSTSTEVATIFIPTIVIFLPVTISAFPQATNMNESINNSDILPLSFNTKYDSTIKSN